MVRLFSIPAFFIVLREVIEACLIIGITHAYFKRIGTAHYIRILWSACVSAIVVSLGLGVAFKIVHAKIGKQLLSGRAEHLFEGSVFLVATGLLTWMIIWVLMVGHKSQNRIEHQLETIFLEDENSNVRKKIAIFIMIFVQVLREGVETFLFIFGSACSSAEHGGWASIPIPGVLAIILGILFSLALFKGFVRLNLQTFFNVSGAVLISFASGLFAHSFNELQAGNILGEWDDMIERPWFNFPMWDTSACCGVKNNEFFAMLRTLFGYSDSPTFLEWGVYVIYWLAIICVLLLINWKRLLSRHNYIRQRAQRLSIFVFIITFVGTVFSFIDRSWLSLATMPHSFLLSTVSIFFVVGPSFAFTAPLLKYRRAMLHAMSYTWGANSFFILALHIAQVVCEGVAKGSCRLQKFFFFALILDQDFCKQGRVIVYDDGGEIVKAYWPAIAVLTISATIGIFVFGAFALRLYLMANHVAPDGTYIGDDDVPPENAALIDVSACSKDIDSASERLSVQVDTLPRDSSGLSEPT